MLFAFARDGGVPLAAWLRAVSPVTATPIHAIVACALAGGALVAGTAVASETAFLAIAALATVALYASYALPVGLGAIARQRGRWRRRGPFSLGRAGVPLAWAAVAWSAAVGGICAVANALSMGLFVALLAGLAGLWIGRVRARFTGPRVDLAHFERRS
jgi:amino acid transporter